MDVGGTRPWMVEGRTMQEHRYLDIWGQSKNSMLQ